MGLFDSNDEHAVMLSRTDEDHALASFSGPSFMLDNKEWPTVEHYFQAMKFEQEDYKDKIRAALSPKLARKLGRNRFKRIRKDWSAVRRIVMTRALYTKCRSHPEVAEFLRDSGSATIIENNNYDYFWGCGRDRRGENSYGKVLMAVRDKLAQESAGVATE